MVISELKIELGKRALLLLDEKGMNPTAFFWFYLSESSSWRLFISSKTFNNKDIKECYEDFVNKFRNEEIIKEIGLSNITLVYNSDYMVNLLKVAIRTNHDSVAGIRFTSNVINGVFIEDAYIYRLF